MRWLTKLFPHGKEATGLADKSEADNRQAEVEHRQAVYMASKMQQTIQDVNEINRTNGFSRSLSYAFARKEA